MILLIAINMEGEIRLKLSIDTVYLLELGHTIKINNKNKVKFVAANKYSIS